LQSETYFYCIISVLNKSIKLIINYCLGPLLFLLLTYSLYRQVIQQPDLDKRWAEIKAGWGNVFFWIAFLLMLVNWGIESLKWKILIQPLQNISFFKAYKAILCGCSITMLTPNRIGEYGGRVFFLSSDQRVKAISLTILGGISQLSVTIILGTIGVVYLLLYPSLTKSFESFSLMSCTFLLIIGIFFSIVTLLFFFKAGMLIKWLSGIKYLRKISKHLECIFELNRKQLLNIFFLSLFRYFIFILQYILFLKVMHVDIALLTSVMLIAVFYFLITVIPTIGFTELPVRAAAGVLILGLFSNNLLGIHAASFSVWLINLFIPSVIGSFLLFKVKFIQRI
jgi:uncharacterized membrane protein YbhN (UPF0104 family)